MPEMVEFCSNTTIKTKLSNEIVISSIYRRYENEHFRQMAWETMVFKGDKIIDQTSNLDIQQTIDSHKEFYDKYA